ncbi:BTB incomplete domain containing protein [Pandoravirus neocaledonia]|uniref:BTB incomplete domain containing protein n=1 Tax=Pandoravirus neocaledonia TaxID=2107708 RepID=A0A2U7UC30_9VIRU|nr:BTB incomplete domain containing protein [Pandoravirus neocaledonia]AVK76017.1 BTB incomplete domain containing protein [Pandoravirus neocaledonia]
MPLLLFKRQRKTSSRLIDKEKTCNNDNNSKGDIHSKKTLGAYKVMSKRKAEDMEADTPLRDAEGDDAFFTGRPNAQDATQSDDDVARNAPRPDDPVVDLDVRGTRMRVLRSTLATGPPDSLLARLFGAEGGPWSRRPQADGSYFIDDDPQDFDAVLCYLRYGAEGMRFESAARAWRARALATYYMLDDMAHACLIEALRADLCATPTHLTATIRYAFADPDKYAIEASAESLDKDDDLFPHYGNERRAKEPTLAPVTIHYVRGWSLAHLLVWIAHAIGVPVDQLEFTGTEWRESSWTGISPYPLGGIHPIDVEACAAYPLASFPWVRAERGGLLVQMRGQATGEKQKSDPLSLGSVPK